MFISDFRVTCKNYVIKCNCKTPQYLNSSCWTTVVNVVKWVIIHTQPKVSSGFSGISRLPSCFFLLAYVNNVVILYVVCTL